MEFIFKIPYLKIALVIYIIVSIPVIYILWKNPSAENNSTHIFTLLGAVLLVIISVIPYLQIDKKTEFSNFVLFRDRQTQHIVAGAFQEPYSTIYTQAFNTVGGTGTIDQISMDIPQGAEYEIIEKAILFQLLSDFNSRDWDSRAINSKGAYGSGACGTMSIGTGSENEIYDAEKLHKIFLDNRYLKDLSTYQSYALRVPPNTTIKRIKNNGSWAIVFENPNFKIVVQPTGFSSSQLMRGAWGLFKGDAEQSNRYTQLQYTLMVHAETKFGKRYTALTESYWKWYDGIVKSVNNFNWDNVDRAILEKKSRDLLWQDVSMFPPNPQTNAPTNQR